MLFGSIYKHFTSFGNGYLFYSFFVVKTTLFNTVQIKVASFNWGHSVEPETDVMVTFMSILILLKFSNAVTHTSARHNIKLFKNKTFGYQYLHSVLLQ